jgi:hypothetical protein
VCREQHDLQSKTRTDICQSYHNQDYDYHVASEDLLDTRRVVSWAFDGRVDTSSSLES